MDRRAHPVDLGARERDSRTRVLACACGFSERWPWPQALSGVDAGRCTCPRCGEPMAEAPRDAPGAVVAFDAAGRETQTL